MVLSLSVVSRRYFYSSKLRFRTSGQAKICDCLSSYLVNGSRVNE